MILSSTVMTTGSAPDPVQASEPVQPSPQWDYNPWPTYNGSTVYHSYPEMVTELFWINENHPDITRLVSIGKSWQGRDIWAMKVSDNPYVEEDEPEVYFNGNHHAREWLTIEINLYTIRYLVDFYGTNSTITNIVDTRQIWFVPSANPDGRVYDSSGDDPAVHARQAYGWRKNCRDNDNSGTFTEAADGVDLNRNYGYLWGSSGATSDPTQDVYGGPYPFSEPETAAIRDFCRQHDFVYAVSFHTYSQLILYPWGWCYEDAPDNAALVATANAMAGVITNKAGSAYPGYTPEKSSGLYPTAGSDDDWLYGELGVFAYCIEAYPNVNDADAAVTGTYDLFHPRADKVIPACQDNMPAALLLCTLANNRFQIIDHVDVKPDEVQATVRRGTSGNVLLNVTDDGRRADSFTVTRTTPAGWTVGISPASMSLAKDGTQTATLSVTVPAGATPGFYKIWVNATSTSNSSCRDSSLVTVNVPYPDDVAPVTLEPFTEMGDFPKGQYRIDSTVQNVGEVSVPAFDTQLTIKQLGVGSTVTLFTDNIESALANQWTIVDHDLTHSASVWQRSTVQRHAGTYSAWCGSGTAYTDSTIQSLMMTNPISLERYNSATLQFWSYYNCENYYDFCMVEGSGDNGQSWDYITRYTGTATSWQLRTLDLSGFLGAEQFKLRFRFTSDDYTTATGFYLDDLTITANDPTQTTVYGPTQRPTSGTLAVGASEELSWTYTFGTAGTFLAEVQTLHGTDGNAANNLRSVMFYINNSRTLPEFGGIKSVTNPGMGQTLEVSWDAGLQINDPLTYRAYRFDHAPSSAEVNASTPIYTGTALECADSTVTAGQTYYYVVRMTDSLSQAEYNVVTLSGTPGISVDQYGLSTANATYNFVGVTQATNNHYAYFNDMDAVSQTELTTPNSRTEFTDTYYANAATSNNVRAGPSADPGTGDFMGTEYRFTVSEAQATLSRIDITHEAQYSAACTVTLYALNDANVWDIIGTTQAFAAATDGTMTRSITSSPANYISASNVLRVVFYPNARATVSVDYAEAKVYYPVPSTDDNTVNWTSAGEDAAYYRIYRSDTQSGTYILVGTVPAGTLTFTDPGAGGADATFWWYIVRPVDGYGAEDANINAVQEPGGGGTPYSINLVGKAAGGWVFVSYPVMVTGHIETVLNDTSNGDGGTQWDRALTWDNMNKKWLSYRKGGSANTFTDVTNYMGLWLHLTSNGGDQALSVPDTGAYPGTVIINLYTGWNLIGYPTATPRLGSATLPIQATTLSVWQAAAPYIADTTPAAVTMSHGNGYWVYVNADCMWTVQP